MATARSDELRALAQRFADALPSQFEEVLLTGSVSRGESDELSDIELLLVFAGERVPDLPPLVEPYQVDVYEDGTIGWDTATLDGEVLEMAAWQPARVEARLAGILAGEMIDHGRMRFADALVRGVPLRTNGAIARWQARLAVYPESLVEPIVLDASEEWLEHPLGVRSHFRPGGRLALTRMVVDDVENVLRIVFALNRTWEPGWKRLPQLLEPLALKPERLAERIDEALRESSLRTARALVRDTLALAPDLPRVVVARERVAALLAEIA